MTPDDVLKEYGSPYKFAEETGMSHTSLYNWMKWGFVPPAAQEKLHILSGGKLKFSFKDDELLKEQDVERFTYFLTENHEAIPCKPSKWSAQFKQMTRDHKRLVAENHDRGYHISTVWVGVDSSFGIINGKPPLILETIIFEPIEGDIIYQKRYSTWKEAQDGHKNAMKWLLIYLKGKK